MSASNPTQLADTTVVKAITIESIELCNQTRRKLPCARQYVVHFSIGDMSQETSPAKEENNHTSWRRAFYFDGDGRSVIDIKVTQKHRITTDKLIGNLSVTVDEVLGDLKDGETKVFERTLKKGRTSDGPDLPGITIKITLTATTLKGADASQLQATHAVGQTAAATFTPIPAVVDLVSAGVGTGTSVVQVQMFENTWGLLLDRVKIFNDIVANVAKIHPYASLAWSVMSAASKVLVDQKNRDDRISRLSKTMSDLFTFVHDAEPLKKIESNIRTMTLLIRQVTECGYFIAEYAKRQDFWIRVVKYTVSDIDARIKVYEDKFNELKIALLKGIALETGLTVVRMMNVVEHIAEAIDLNDMPYARDARHVLEKGCLPGTRESLLQEVCDVLNNPDEGAPRVCLLTGVAGSGKSAVAHTIAHLYDGQQRLGSSYCFSKAELTKRNPQNLFSTIARGLADHDSQFKSILWGIVKDNRSLRTSTSPSEQIERFIIQPSVGLHTVGPLVVVIDALDESGDDNDRCHLLGALSRHLSEGDLPTNLRFLITTRPESDILAALSSSRHIVRKHMGDIPDEVVDQDLERVIHYTLRQHPEPVLIDQETCQQLVERSQHLFQWAATACKVICGTGTVGLTSSQRLQIIFANNPSTFGPLDGLYKNILCHLFTADAAKESFRKVMAIVLGLKEPLSLDSLRTLFGSDGDLNIQGIIKPMGSLLDGVLDQHKPIRLLHSSFRDFLCDEKRSSMFHIPIQLQHSITLGRALLACMRRMLKFNICELKDSRILNTDVPNLQSRVALAIPPHLSYACQHWMGHVIHMDCTSDLLDEVTLFFKTHLPYWLEAISLLSLSTLLPIQSAASGCITLTTWAKVR